MIFSMTEVARPPNFCRRSIPSLAGIPPRIVRSTSVGAVYEALHLGRTSRPKHAAPREPDDYVADTNPLRVVDVFVDELDRGKLGFAGVVPAETGRPSYHPAVLLKIYIYDYLNHIQSSRRLEH